MILAHDFPPLFPCPPEFRLDLIRGDLGLGSAESRRQVDIKKEEAAAAGRQPAPPSLTCRGRHVSDPVPWPLPLLPRGWHSVGWSPS